MGNTRKPARKEIRHIGPGNTVQRENSGVGGKSFLGAAGGCQFSPSRPPNMSLSASGSVISK